ncbi:ergosterol biosynthesis protein [Cladochytrium tenue]|nr:ergosterol biosynthesis protein [Cladochytrium tenue]
MRVTTRIYALQPEQVTDLASRMMGTWTLTSAIIRCYAAYNLSNKTAYQLCMWTFALALGSFTSEIFLFETAPISSPGVFPALIVSSTSLAWMALNYAKYTGASKAKIDKKWAS